MKSGLPILAVLAGFGSLFSWGQSKPISTPLDRYIESLRTHASDPLLLSFAESCGVEVKTAPARMGFANDDRETWRVVSDLPEAYDHRVAYLIDTAAMWKQAEGIVLEEWNGKVDWGSYSRELYCFNADGKLRALDKTAYQTQVDGGLRFAVHMRWKAGPSGAFVATEPMRFIGSDGEAVKEPKLTSDERNFLSYWRRAPGPMTLGDLKLGALLQ